MQRLFDFMLTEEDPERIIGDKAYDSDWPASPSEDWRFVWAGWRLLAEIDALATGDAPDATRRFVWGLDLAGQLGLLNSMEAAGGIGGLLAISDPNDPCDPADTAGDFVYTYDANGNVGQLIGLTPTSWDAGTVMVARYEYDPYGKVIGPDDDDDGDWRDDAGPYAVENPIRFSTKYFDDETGLGYWGERYYDPVTGRWTSWDPIGEEGGLNLYVYVGNLPVTDVDPLGLQSSQPACNCTTDVENIGTWSANMLDAPFQTKGLLGWIDSVNSKFSATYWVTDDCWRCCCKSLGLVQVARHRYSDEGSWSGLQVDKAPKPTDPNNEQPPKPYYALNSKECPDSVSMVDTPGVRFITSNKLEQEFEVCAVCEKPNGSRVAISCISWGHKFHYHNNQKIWIAGKKKSVDHEVYSAHRWIENKKAWGWYAIDKDRQKGDFPFSGAKGPDGKKWFTPRVSYRGAGHLPPKDWWTDETGIESCK